jgi:predicted nucleic acid-binding Zn ribbon protein
MCNWSMLVQSQPSSPFSRMKKRLHKCIICNNEYIANVYNSKYCSKECKKIIDKEVSKRSYTKLKDKILKKRKEAYDKIRGVVPDRDCVICGKIFYPDIKTKVVCSKECALEKTRKQCRESHYRNREKRLAYKHKHYNENIEKLKELGRKYFNKNKNEILSKRREKYHNNIEEEREKDRIYRSNNKDKVSKWNRNQRIKHPKYFKEYTKKYQPIANENRKNRRKTDINFKLRGQIRSRIKGAIKDQWGIKSQKTIDLLGCSVEEAKKHIESQFKEGMSWDNWSFKGWHIDHIKPCASFDLRDPEQQKECFNYKNLQPLWWWENLSKSNKHNS